MGGRAAPIGVRRAPPRLCRRAGYAPPHAGLRHARSRPRRAAAGVRPTWAK